MGRIDSSPAHKVGDQEYVFKSYIKVMLFVLCLYVCDSFNKNIFKLEDI